jgi:hypothetical protein
MCFTSLGNPFGPQAGSREIQDEENAGWQKLDTLMKCSVKLFECFLRIPKHDCIRSIRLGVARDLGELQLAALFGKSRGDEWDALFFCTREK